MKSNVILFDLWFNVSVNNYGHVERVLAGLDISGNQYLAHIFSPVTDNCPTWISSREKMALEMISWPIST